MKKILYAASEAVPFIKTGGLADVAGTLPKCFPKDEYDVRIMIPKYACMNHTYEDNLQRIVECQVQLNWRTQYCGVLETEVDGITCYLIDNEYYFAGDSPYSNIYLDAEKFAYFSKAVLTVLPMIDFQPDIIHTHDWQTGLVPVFLEAQFRGDPFYRYIRTIHTIHNIRFQGRWYIDAVKDITGLPEDYFTPDKLESYGKANLLKGGLVYANRITTVSKTYAKEIQTESGGEGLDGLMRARSGQLSGIVNGIDYDHYNPKTDPEIASRLQGSKVEKFKKENKKALQEELGLEQDPGAFLIGMVTRLTDQKGLDLLVYIREQLMQEANLQLVVLGTGEEQYENILKEYAWNHQGRVCAWIGYSDETAHRIYAGADAFLMPSLFEPCGLSQLISLRYGTVPLVRETGGLKDTVEPYDEFEHTGTGFTFKEYNAHEMLYMIRRAKSVFEKEPEEWKGIVSRGMEKDFSWNHSASGYEDLYDALIQEAEAQKETDIAYVQAEARAKVAAIRQTEQRKPRRKKSSGGKSTKSAGTKSGRKTSGKSTAKSRGKTSAKSTGKNTGKTSVKSAGETSVKSAGKTSAKSAGETSAKSAGKSAAESTEKNVTESTGKSVTESTDKGVAKSTEKSVAENTKKNVAKSTDKGAAKSTGEGRGKTSGA